MKRVADHIAPLLAVALSAQACSPAGAPPGSPAPPPDAAVATAAVQVSPPAAATGGATGPTLEPRSQLPAPPPGLVGKTWTLVGFAEGMAVTDILPGQEPNLSFSPAGVAGFSGCNSLSGSLAQADADPAEGALRFGPLAVTEMACAEAERNAQEARFLTLLPRVARYRLVDAQSLVLEDAQGQAGLLLSSTPPQP